MCFESAEFKTMNGLTKHNEFYTDFISRCLADIACPLPLPLPRLFQTYLVNNIKTIFILLQVTAIVEWRLDGNDPEKNMNQFCVQFAITIKK